ncbi:MAG: NAD(+) synthase [Clostridiales Family XIII bacterium]|jgi:NAD+ synthase (glutamine-hydrolysing)|nr:NAD(+) synthase [Clostridiales Family XIII bacterium]
MIDGFIRVAAATPGVKVADCAYNAERIEEAARAAASRGARLVVLPELSLTGYTCGDLFLQDTLLDAAKDALSRLVVRSEGHEEVVVVGMPLAYNGKLYNVAAVYSDGQMLAFVPKTYLPNYGEFYERRHFTSAFRGVEYVNLEISPGDGDDVDDADANGPDGVVVIPIYDTDDDFYDDDEDDEDETSYEDIPFGTDIIFRCEDEPEFAFAVEICEDLWAPSPPSVRHAAHGAIIIANPSAGNETIGKASYRRLLTRSQSGRLICGYVYANAGLGESTQDMVFSGHCVIAENGAVIAENPPFGSSRGGIVLSDIDVRGLARDRRYNDSFVAGNLSPCAGGRPYDDEGSQAEYEEALFSQPGISDGSNGVGVTGVVEIGVISADPVTANTRGKVIRLVKPGETKKEILYRRVDRRPFVPQSETERAERCEEILAMQSAGLMKRLAHTGAKAAFVGVSGGLDSTLALLVSVRAARAAGLGAEAVRAVTMPGFGTTDQTKGNAEKLCAALGVSLREIDITDQVKVHLRSIGHEETARDVTYENAQARVRTLILMDLSNRENGIVVGTGDLSELALGWATFNGDHMSMYGVNAGVPKSLVRHIIKYAADAEEESNPALSATLNDIIATPVSPELLPPEDGDISQRTEDIIGPYELHDFFLYHMVRWGRRPRVIFELAKIAFAKPDGEAETESADAEVYGAGAYAEDEIKVWLKVFLKRFFANQFKRSTLPDGPKIGSVTLSPRADWRMPPDASVEAWLRELE